jgi:2-dehydro-3-deoxyphosphogluconate aldolase/(4S)-4-hydroxy-2-oxoglutarate aldolase
MANFTRIEVFNKMNQTGLVPLFYNSDIEICKKVVTACYNGGARLLEFTARGDFAHEVFTDLNKFVIKKFPELYYYTSLYKRLPSKENQYYLSRVVPIKNYY